MHRRSSIFNYYINSSFRASFTDRNTILASFILFYIYFIILNPLKFQMKDVTLKLKNWPQCKTVRELSERSPMRVFYRRWDALVASGVRIWGLYVWVWRRVRVCFGKWEWEVKVTNKVESFVFLVPWNPSHTRVIETRVHTNTVLES